jgi:hypothetical protein
MLPEIVLNGEVIKLVDTVKYLGVIFDKKTVVEGSLAKSH